MPRVQTSFVNVTLSRCQRTQQGLPRDPYASLCSDAPVTVLLSQDAIPGPRDMKPLVSSGVPWFSDLGSLEGGWPGVPENVPTPGSSEVFLIVRFGLWVWERTSLS